jgi:23S rRNA-/tRNA-specific pseudouridylate synthase
MRWILWISLLTESYSFGWNLLARCHPDAFRAPRTTLLSSTATNNAEGDCTQIIRILYETDSILAIEKPEGVSHHDGEQEQGILTLVRQCQNDGSIEYSGRIFGVHRLDRVTSGILLLAKNQDTASKLTAAFRDGHVVKYYVGVSSKKPRKKQGWVRGNMERGRRKSWYLTRGGEKGSTYAIMEPNPVSTSYSIDFEVGARVEAFFAICFSERQTSVHHNAMI